THELSEHAMTMFVLNPAHHGWNPVKRAEGCGPIGYRQSSIVAGYQCPGHYQKKNQSSQNDCKNMMAAVVDRFRWRAFRLLMPLLTFGNCCRTRIRSAIHLVILTDKGIAIRLARFSVGSFSRS